MQPFQQADLEHPGRPYFFRFVEPIMLRRSHVNELWENVAHQIEETPNLTVVPPKSRFFVRTLRRAVHLWTDESKSAEAIVRQAIRDIEREDICRVAAVIAQKAAHCARDFNLDPDEITNETFCLILPGLPRNYKADAAADEETENGRLKRYIHTAVKRTAWHIVRRARRLPTGAEELLDQLADDMDVFSEIARRDEVRARAQSLRNDIAAEYGERLSAIERCGGSIAKAARELGMQEDTLRHWVLDLRRRLSERPGD